MTKEKSFVALSPGVVSDVKVRISRQQLDQGRTGTRTQNPEGYVIKLLGSDLLPIFCHLVPARTFDLRLMNQVFYHPANPTGF